MKGGKPEQNGVSEETSVMQHGWINSKVDLNPKQY